MNKEIGIFVLLVSLVFVSIACFSLGNSTRSETDSALYLTVTANAQIMNEMNKPTQEPTQQPAENEQEIITNETIPVPTEEESVLPRATLTNQEVINLSETFDSVDLQKGWTIYRPNAQSWDLTSRRGTLHIVGQKREALGYQNIFAVHITSDNLLVTTKIVGEFNQETQGAWIGFSPNQYVDNSQSVMLSLDYYGFGYRVNMWECPTDSFCIDTNNLGFEKLDNRSPDRKKRYPGYIYFRIYRKGSSYMGHWSIDGKNWEFLGEAKNFPVITDQVILGAGCMKCNTPFDVYFEQVQFEVPKLK